MAKMDEEKRNLNELLDTVGWIGATADRLVEYHLDWVKRNRASVVATGVILWDKEKRIEDITSLLETRDSEDFEPQKLIDITMYGLGAQRAQQPNVLMSSLINALYCIGYNGMEIDVDKFGDSNQQPRYIAGSIVGPQGNRLTLTVRGENMGETNVGSHSTSCHFTVLGDVHSIGEWSKDSEFHQLNGTFDRVGDGAEKCSFYLNSLDKNYWSADAPVYNIVVPKRCRVYVQEPVDLEVVRALSTERGFFDNNNRLYVARGNGRWKRWKRVRKVKVGPRKNLLPLRNPRSRLGFRKVSR